MSLPNDNILKALGESVGLFSAFNHADKVMEGTLSALIDLLSNTGYVNIDLNDFVTVMSQTGDAVLGVATTNDASAVEIAVQSAMNNPIYETLNIGTAKGALIQINIREEISMGTYNMLVDALRMLLPADSLLVNGITHKPEQENLIEVFVIGTGITEQSALQETTPKADKPVALCRANVESELEVSQHLDKKIEQIPQIAEASQPTPNEYLHIPAFLRKQSKTE
jgi:cell division protein FtsZ